MHPHAAPSRAALQTAAALLLAAGLLAAGACHSGSKHADPLTPADTLAGDPASASAPGAPFISPTTPLETLPDAGTNPGMVASALGWAEVTLNGDLTYAMDFPREGQQAQGDQFRLTMRPFFDRRHIQVVKVRRAPIAGVNAVVLTLRFTHPFPAPVDLAPPATATKRVDLNIFKPIAVILNDDSPKSFVFDTPVDVVRANVHSVVNADGYLKPGATLDTPNGFISNTFPFVHVTPLDASALTTNYDQLNHGWQGSALLAPTGFGVFAQGSSHETDFAFDIAEGETFSFALALMAEYQDPRLFDAADPLFPKPRLPVPGDPTRLRYILPAGAGDNSRTTATFPDASANTLPTNNSTTTRMVVDILDWDNQTPVSAPWPNDADLFTGLEPSGTVQVSATVPDVTLATVQGVALPGGTGWPGAPIQWELQLRNTFNQSTEGAYPGMLRVIDEQAGANVIDLTEIDTGPGYALGPPLPVPLGTIVYQTFSVQIEGTFCGQLSFSMQDGTGGALNNNDTIRYRVARTSGLVPVSPWDFDVAYTGAIVENPPVVSGIDLTTPYLSAPSVGLVQNDTRSPVTVTLAVQAANGGPLDNCADVLASVAANAEPQCPATNTVTDPGGGPLNSGDRVRVNWSGITDADNTLAQVTVDAQFDFTNNGSWDETVAGIAASTGFATSTGTVSAGSTVAVRLILNDNAGPASPCSTITQAVGGVCGSYSAQIEDGGGSTTINHNDNIRLRFTPLVAGTWSFDPQSFSAGMSGATDFAAVGTTGVTPVTTALSGTHAVNNTRSPISGTFSIVVDADLDAVPSTCAAITGNIAANAQPGCPASSTLTDSVGGSLEPGELISFNWSGITDADNPSAEISVSVAFDVNNDGSVDETVVGAGYNGTVTTTTTAGRAQAARVCRAVMTISDTAGAVAPCAPVTTTVPSACTLFGITVEDLGASTTINHNDRFHLVFTPSVNLPQSWSWDPQPFALNMSGNTDLAPVTGSGLGPFQSADTATWAENFTRSVLTNGLDIDIATQIGTGPVETCPCLRNIAANVAPTCPPAQGLSDPALGALEGGEPVRYSWSGITDPDDFAADVTVQVRYDFTNNGSFDETINTTGLSGNVSSTGLTVPGETVRVVATIGDSAGTIGACTELTEAIPTLCASSVTTAEDSGGSATLNHGDSFRLIFDPDADSTLQWTWDPASFSANMSGAEDFAAVNGTGAGPFQSALSGATIVNDTRAVITDGISISIPTDLGTYPQETCSVSFDIAANEAPTCPSTLDIENSTGVGPPLGLDQVMVSWDGITDSDNASADIAVTIELDWTNDGIVDETLNGTGYSGSLTSTGVAVGLATLAVTVTIADNAGSLGCGTTTIFVP